MVIPYTATDFFQTERTQLVQILLALEIAQKIEAVYAIRIIEIAPKKNGGAYKSRVIEIRQKKKQKTKHESARCWKTRCR